MSAINVTRREVRLASGVLRLTAFDNRRLVVGQLVEGSVDENDVLEALSQAGFKAGVIPENVALLTRGVRSQVPLAAAEVIQIPARTTAPGLDLAVEDHAAATVEFPDLMGVEVIHYVTAGQVLFTVDAPPKTILRLPTGEEQPLSEGDALNARLFTGENTTVGDDGKTVVSNIDGYAHRSVFGKVAVYPVEELPGVGRMHGRVYKEASLVVQQDVGDGSRVEVQGDLKVDGSVHSATVAAAGNVQIGGEASNPSHLKEAHITAGQSLRVRRLQELTVWAGSHVVATEGVRKCQVEVMNALVTPLIADSEVAVGNRLIVRDIQGECTLKLGSKWITAPALREKSLVCTQHRKRLEDIERQMIEYKSAYTKARSGLAQQIQRMRDPAATISQKKMVVQSLLRLFNAMTDALEIFQGRFKDFSTVADQLAREEAELDYYRHLKESFPAPEIVVTGTLAAGALIQGPVDSMKVEQDLSKVAIAPDPQTGKLTVTPLGG